MRLQVPIGFAPSKGSTLEPNARALATSTDPHHGIAYLVRVFSEAWTEVSAVLSDVNLRSADPPLLEYRVYALDARSRIFHPTRFVEAVNDENAIEMAAQLLDRRAIELWERDRLVFRLNPEKSPRVSAAK